MSDITVAQKFVKDVMSKFHEAKSEGKKTPLYTCLYNTLNEWEEKAKKPTQEPKEFYFSDYMRKLPSMFDYIDGDTHFAATLGSCSGLRVFMEAVNTDPTVIELTKICRKYPAIREKTLEHLIVLPGQSQTHLGYRHPNDHSIATYLLVLVKAGISVASIHASITRILNASNFVRAREVASLIYEGVELDV